jgi:hypothetical protein
VFNVLQSDLLRQCRRSLVCVCLAPSCGQIPTTLSAALMLHPPCSFWNLCCCVSIVRVSPSKLLQVHQCSSVCPVCWFFQNGCLHPQHVALFLPRGAGHGVWTALVFACVAVCALLLTWCSVSISGSLTLLMWLLLRPAELGCRCILNTISPRMKSAL